MKTKSLLATPVTGFKEFNPKWIISLLLTIFIANDIYSQQRPTTELEYNYVTTGYRIQFAQGQDIKQGYSLKEIQHSESSAGKATFKALYRAGESKPCAIMLIVETAILGTKYLCIPSADAGVTLWGKFETGLDENLHYVPALYKLVLMNLAALQMKSYGAK